MVAQDAHDAKLLKSLEVCKKEGIHFVPLAWESTASGLIWRGLARVTLHT